MCRTALETQAQGEVCGAGERTGLPQTVPPPHRRELRGLTEPHLGGDRPAPCPGREQKAEAS